MNCQAAREHLVDLLDIAPDPALKDELMAHLTTCPLCSGEFEALKRTMERLLPRHMLSASPALKETVMKKVVVLNCQETTERAPRRIRMLRPILAAAIAVVVVIGASFGAWLAKTGGHRPLSAFSVLGGAAHAMAELQSVHIAARLRTAPGENFETILMDEELVPVECWKRFYPKSQWRIENAGRVIVMDGEEATLWIRQLNEAAKSADGLGFAGWLGLLMDVDQVLEREQRLAEEEGSKLTLERATGADGGEELVVCVEATAKGDYANDWCRNTSIAESDNLRIYRFAADTLWLKGLQIFFHTQGGDVLAFETTAVDYNVQFDDALFALDLPADVSWYAPPQQASTEQASENETPRQAASAFFDACAREDWAEVEKYYPVSPTPEKFKAYVGKLEVVSIGEPFKSGVYSGWFVPYEIRLNNGETKKMNLALRNDNPAKQFTVDGGL